MEKESNNCSDPDPLTHNHNSDNSESLPKPNNDHHDEPNQKDESYDQDEPTSETPLKKTPTSSIKHLTTLKVLKKPSLRGLKAPQSPWRYAISRTRASKTSTGNGQLFKKASSENLSTNNLVQINVAGLKFKTKRSTLRRFPNTLLGSDELEEYYVSERNEYFFDRSRSTFESILYFYQSNGVMCLPSSVNPDVFVEELKFFKFGEKIVAKFNAASNIKRESIKGEFKHTLKEKIWLLCDDPNSGRIAKVIGYLDQIIILLAVAAQCIESLPTLRLNTNHDEVLFNNFTVTQANSLLHHVEVVSIVWFTLIFILRAITCPDKLSFCKAALNWMDFLAILPFYLQLVLTKSKPYLTILRFFRTIRIVRIFKISRYFQGLFALGKALSASAGELLLLSLMLATFVVLFSSLVYFADSCDCDDDVANCIEVCAELGPNQFDSVVAGFWWSLVTMSTVGYGDYVPKTPLGKVVGGLCALTGILVISLPFPLIITNFNKFMRFRGSKSKVFATIADGYSDDVPCNIPEYTGIAYGFVESLNSETLSNQDHDYQTIPVKDTSSV